MSITVRGVNNGQQCHIDPAAVVVSGQELLVDKWVIIRLTAAKPRCFLGTYDNTARS